MKKLVLKERRIKFTPEDTPGVICLDRTIQGDAVVISGTLKLGCDSRKLSTWLEKAVKKAAGDVKTGGGTMGQIKAALSRTKEEVITVTEDNGIETESSRAFSRVSIAAVIYISDPKTAENIIREALSSVRASARELK